MTIYLCMNPFFGDPFARKMRRKKGKIYERHVFFLQNKIKDEGTKLP